MKNNMDFVYFIPSQSTAKVFPQIINETIGHNYLKERLFIMQGLAEYTDVLSTFFAESLIVSDKFVAALKQIRNLSSEIDIQSVLVTKPDESKRRYYLLTPPTIPMRHIVFDKSKFVLDNKFLGKPNETFVFKNLNDFRLCQKTLNKGSVLRQKSIVLSHIPTSTFFKTPFSSANIFCSRSVFFRLGTVGLTGFEESRRFTIDYLVN